MKTWDITDGEVYGEVVELCKANLPRGAIRTSFWSSKIDVEDSYCGTFQTILNKSIRRIETRRETEAQEEKLQSAEPPQRIPRPPAPKREKAEEDEAPFEVVMPE